MAKESMKAREVKRQKLVDRYASKRKALKDAGLKSTIFFNISKKKADRLKSQEHKEQCPCDTGLLAAAKACSFCNKCWRSSTTKKSNWNNLNIGDVNNEFNNRVISTN